MNAQIICYLSIALVSIGCRNRPPISATPPPGLDGQADRQASAAVPGGAKAFDGLKGVAYGEDQTSDYPIQLDPKNCYVFAAVGEPSVEKLAMYLFDPTDDRVESESGKGRVQLSYCPEVPGMFRLQAKVGEGRGHFAIAGYSRPAAPKAAPAAPAPQVDLASLVEQEAKATAPGASRVGEFFSGSADKTDWFTAFEAGKCYWIIGFGKPDDVDELWLYLWDPQNSRVSESKSETNKVVLGHCPKSGGMFKFQAKVNSGSGEYKVGVYAKPAK